MPLIEHSCGPEKMVRPGGRGGHNLCGAGPHGNIFVHFFTSV